MLSQAKITAAKPKQRPYKLFDEKGLYLIINPNGSRYWRYKYRFEGVEKTISLGVYPDVRLRAARKRHLDFRQMLAEDGIDPSAKRKAEKVARADSFRAIAEEWIDKGCPGRGSKGNPGPRTIRQLRRRMEVYVYPWIGNKSMQSIGLEDMRGVLDRITRKGTHETANRVRSLCDRVFRFAIATGRAERNFAADLRDAVPVASATSFAAITDPKQFGALLNAIDGYQGHPVTMYALQLAALTFVRPGELRNAEWSEINMEAAEWSIPQSRMKEKQPHLVPLSKQAVAILKDLQRHTGTSDYLFPSLRSVKRPMSDNTMNAALRRMGYTKSEMTTHGFRSSASTMLNEMGANKPKLGINRELIETQLAHKRPGVEGIYNRSHLKKPRAKMMQRWANYLDDLRAAAK